jgi:beta-glucosidase
MDGDEVPQIYLGPPETAPEGAQFAVKALAGFERVHIRAGQSRDVAVHVPPRRLQYWSAANRAWATAAGARTVFVASSSRDVRLQGELNLPR